MAEQAKRANQVFSFTYDLSTAAGIQKYRELNPAASIGWSDTQIEAFAQKGGTLQQLIQQGVINPYAGYGGGMPSHEEGGPTVAGPAMLHAGEYVVPKDGTLVRGGSDGVLENNLSITLDGRVLAQSVTTRQLNDLRLRRRGGFQ